jgi:hypothetical protein
MAMQDLIRCRHMELLSRQRATFFPEESWKWLGEAERWQHLAHEESATQTKPYTGPTMMGPNTIDGTRSQNASQRKRRVA